MLSRFQVMYIVYANLNSLTPVSIYVGWMKENVVGTNISWCKNYHDLTVCFGTSGCIWCLSGVFAIADCIV